MISFSDIRKHKIYKNGISKAFYRNVISEDQYERSFAVTTNFGFVMVYAIRWPNNKAIDIFTQFETIVDGYKYYAYINESGLSDRVLINLATIFIKQIKKMQRS